jgi:hypothetical protein
VSRSEQIYRILRICEKGIDRLMWPGWHEVFEKRSTPTPGQRYVMVGYTCERHGCTLPELITFSLSRSLM